LIFLLVQQLNVLLAVQAISGLTPRLVSQNGMIRLLLLGLDLEVLRPFLWTTLLLLAAALVLVVLLAAAVPVVF